MGQASLAAFEKIERCDGGSQSVVMAARQAEGGGKRKNDVLCLGGIPRHSLKNLLVDLKLGVYDVVALFAFGIGLGLGRGVALRSAFSAGSLWTTRRTGGTGA